MSEFPAPPPLHAGPSYTGDGPSGPRAGFGIRLSAALIDGILLSVAGFVLRLIVGQTGGSAIGIAIGVAYFGYLAGSASGQTIGKRLVGIRVIDFGTGGPIGFGRAVIRYFGRVVSLVACLLG